MRASYINYLWIRIVILLSGGEIMNWIETMSASINYMDEHLLEELNVKDIAEVALTSTFYYQRTFYMLTGMSVQEYIRNRRLSLAAQELQMTDIKIIDLAFKYGYESSEAFSRAFKKVHGENPSKVRKHQLIVKSFPKLIIQVSLKGDIPMNYKIEKKDGFTFYGIAREFSTENGENFEKIPKFWDEVMGNGTYEDMIRHSKNEQCIGACMPLDSDTGTKFDYVIGAFSDRPIDGYDVYEVPATEWAVFRSYTS